MGMPMGQPRATMWPWAAHGVESVGDPQPIGYETGALGTRFPRFMLSFT